MAGSVELSGPDLGIDGIPAEAVGATPAVGHYDEAPVVVVRTDAGIRAVGGRCTHYGGALGDGLCADGQIRCPLHHAVFDLDTGVAVGAPALDPIPVYATTERNGRIFVTARLDPPPPPTPTPTAPDSVVIIGAGAAGATAAETLRNEGYRGQIDLVGEEAPVDRPNVSKDYLAGTAPEEWMPLRGAGFYDDHHIELISGRRVAAMDRARRVVRISDGTELTYGALLLAPGAEPRRLSVPGADLPHVHYLRTLEDSRRIIAALDDGTRAAIIGAGFVGLEVAASFRHRDVPVTVIAPEAIPLALHVGDTLGRYVEQMHRDHGVDLRLGHQVTGISETGVVLDSGATVVADLVVVGAGASPPTERAEAAGLDVDDGIIVDDRLRTGDPSIWAAGDAARYPGPDGRHRRIEHWVAAQRQGQAAARNILGADEPFTEPPFFWSEHYGVRINVTGYFDDWDEETVHTGLDGGEILVGLHKDGAVRAVASIGRDLDNLRAEHALAVGDQERLEDLLGGVLQQRS